METRLRGCSRWISIIAKDYKYFDIVAGLLLVGEMCLLSFVIKFVPYTEIDWVAYMQEVEGVLNGTFDYALLKGNTGPLVYPAGFVYVFALLYYLTNNGSDIVTAQWIYAGVYMLNLMIVLGIYRNLCRSNLYPPYIVLFLGCTAYRVHSIYVLRLFNDPFSMLLLYFAVWLFLEQKWTFGSIVYSLAVSIKMNVLLFSPGLLILYLRFLGCGGTLIQLAICAFVQVLLGAPFIYKNPTSYLHGAFNFGRVFLYKWTVNWRMLPEWLFLNKYFHVALLCMHLFILFAFACKYWITDFKSLGKWKVLGKCDLSKSEMALILFSANLIGVTFSRSLHYQFYVWYFHSLPLLLWSTDLHLSIRIGLLLLLEWGWNVYPSTMLSSATLLTAHLVILIALYNKPRTLAIARKKH